MEATRSVNSSGILDCEVLGIVGRTTLQWTIQNWCGGLAELGKDVKLWQADTNIVMSLHVS